MAAPTQLICYLSICRVPTFKTKLLSCTSMRGRMSRKKVGRFMRVFYQRSSPTDTTLTAATERFGAIRPLVTETRRTPYTTPTTALDVNWFRRNLFYEDKKFQVLGAGIDGIYGGRIAKISQGLITTIVQRLF